VDYLYSAPYAGIYRGMGIVAANGVNTLPHNCLLIACLMGLGAVIMNLIRVRPCLAPLSQSMTLIQHGFGRVPFKLLPLAHISTCLFLCLPVICNICLFGL